MFCEQTKTDEAMSWLDFSFRIVLALLFGALIGLERQWRQRRAGLRTNALASWKVLGEEELVRNLE